MTTKEKQLLVSVTLLIVIYIVIFICIYLIAKYLNFSVKDITSIVTAFTAFFALVLAVSGYDAWKNELRGKTEYELARRYLRAVYKTRDALKFVRNSFVSSNEMNTAVKEMDVDDPGDSYQINRAVYSIRWQKVAEAESDLDVEMLEAEVSWGPEAISVEGDFQMCVRELYASLKLYIDVGKEHFNREMFYDQGDNDKFNLKMRAAIKKIEDYLSPHLK